MQRINYKKPICNGDYCKLSPNELQAKFPNKDIKQSFLKGTKKS